MNQLASSVEQTEDQFLVGVYHRYPLVLASGQGCYVFDTQGCKYLDAITGVGVNALGHAHPKILSVLVEQACQAVHLSNLYYHPYQGQLAERLCALSGLDRAFFCSTGTEAMEAALKAARARGTKLGKTEFVAIERSFHGRTVGSLAVTGQPKYRAPFEPLTPATTFVTANDLEQLEAAVSNRIAAIVLEPILGEGGIVPLSDAFLQRARELATQHGALLIADEIQCGLGRTGRVFAYEWAGIRPDIVTIAKPLAAGLPLGATLFTEEAAAALEPGSHGTTFGGGPLACRVALEFLNQMESLLPHVRQVGMYLSEELTRLWGRYGWLREIRGRGLMLGLQLDRPARPIVERAIEHGLLANATQETVLRMLPPYILEWEQADEVVRTLDRVFSEA
jgi:predicted acetylornithine/succinylornithine family transaminase